MYQLLIVDDERSVVEGVAATLPCEQLGIDAVHKAYSASDALHIMKHTRIDVVISDIRMPGLSGLDLIERARDAAKPPQCILLTGHAEFEYAKRALRSGASDYLLKPVDDGDLIGAVEKALAAVQDQREAKMIREDSLKTMRQNLPLLRQELLLRLLQGGMAEGPALEEKLASLSLPFRPGDPLRLLLIRLEEPYADYSAQDRTLIEYAVCNIAEELLQGSCSAWFGKETNGYIVAAVKPLDFAPSGRTVPADIGLKQIGEELQHRVRRYLKGTVSIVISEPGFFPQHMPVACSQGISAFRKNIGTSKGFLLPLGDHGGKTPVGALRHLYEPPTLSDLLEAGRWDAYMEKLHTVFDELENEFGDSAEHALEAFCAITGSLTFIAHKSGYGLFDFMEPGADSPANFQSYRTLRQLRETMLRLAGQVRNELGMLASGSQSKLIHNIRQFIEERLDQGISLHMIAEHVHLHPVYVSQMYKNETGEGLSEYMVRIRMEKSAYLLKTTKLRIYEIGAKLGYQQSPYFIKVFKKAYGMTPQEYRDRYSV